MSSQALKRESLPLLDRALTQPVNEVSDGERWLAKFAGQFNGVGGRTYMGKTQHYGPLRVQRPFFPEGEDCLHFYLLHPPGGLVGGDKLSIQLHATESAHLLMTTPSAGKVYRNITGHKQGQFVDIQVDDNAIVEYLPQENIVFNAANGQLNTQVDIYGSGVFIGWEITCLGRYESGDHFEQGQLHQTLMIRHDDRPLFNDRFVLNAPSDLQTGRAGLQEFNVFATFIINRDVMNSKLEEELAEWQRVINETMAPAMIALTQKPNVFIARMLADKSEQVKNTFEELWTRLRPEVIGKQAMVPRIWRT
jgi:urease accessory protein